MKNKIFTSVFTLRGWSFIFLNNNNNYLLPKIKKTRLRNR